MHLRRTALRHTPTSLVTPVRTGSRPVAPKELAAARSAVAQLPVSDRRLLARHGLRVELVAARSLEDGMLGATNIVRGSEGRWLPTRIRVASGIEGRGPSSLAEVVQHEIGHAISVLRRQDQSESAARAYARRF